MAADPDDDCCIDVPSDPRVPLTPAQRRALFGGTAAGFMTKLAQLTCLQPTPEPAPCDTEAAYGA